MNRPNDSPLIDPNSLKLLTTVIEEGSFTKAAIRSHLSQPAVSMKIKELETQMGFPLFERRGPTVIPTKSATAVLAGIEDILTAYHNFDGLRRSIANSEGYQLKIAVSMTIAEYLLPIWLSEIKASNNLQVERVEIGNTSHVIELVSRGEVDIGLIEGATAPHGLEATSLLEDDLVLVATRKHLETKRFTNRIPKRLVEKCDFILRESGSGTREVFEQEIAAVTSNYHVILTLPSTTAIKGAVSRSMGIGVVSRLAVGNELESGAFIEVTLEGLSMSRTLREVHRPNQLSRSSKSFLDVIKSTSLSR